MYIYKFEHEGNKYIGSTKNFKMRCSAHNQHKKQERHNKTKFYKYLIENDIIDIRPFTEIIEKIDDEYDKFKLRELEQDCLDEFQPNLNSFKAMRR